jgi:hypothetical protein
VFGNKNDINDMSSALTSSLASEDPPSKPLISAAISNNTQNINRCESTDDFNVENHGQDGR